MIWDESEVPIAGRARIHFLAEQSIEDFLLTFSGSILPATTNNSDS
jgi:hypothetical protein